MFQATDHSLDHDTMGSSTRTAATDLHDLAAATTAESAAECLAEWLVTYMIENWKQYKGELLKANYDLIHATDPRFDLDSLNLYSLSQDDFPIRTGSGDRICVFHYDSVIPKIPMLINRRDTMRELSTWLPLIPNYLADLFSRYRRALAPADNPNASADPVEFHELPLPLQVRSSLIRI
jgi:hypothetical protein